MTKGYFPVAVGLLSLYSSASERYRDAAAIWEDLLRRGGRTPRPGEDLRAAIPFPEALIPHAEHPGPHEIAFPDEVRPAGSVAPHRRRRRRGRGGRPGEAA